MPKEVSGEILKRKGNFIGFFCEQVCGVKIFFGHYCHYFHYCQYCHNCHYCHKPLHKGPGLTTRLPELLSAVKIVKSISNQKYLNC